MPKESQGPCVGVSMESLVQDHNQLWALSPIKIGSTESTSIIAEFGSYKSTSGESYL